MLVSTVTHLVVLLGLGMIFVASEAKPERFVIESGGPEETAVEEFTPLEFEPAEAADELAESADLPPVAFEAVDAVTLPLADLAASADLEALDADPVMPESFAAADLLATIGEAAAGGAAGGGEAAGHAGRGGVRQRPAPPLSLAGRVRAGVSVSFATTPTAIETAASRRCSRGPVWGINL